jgi:RNA polymerase sigma-70 factor (ECF subfamily)
MPDDDAQLMLDFQRGDSSAFDGLVRKYHVQVINIIYRFLGQSPAAEDLAQDVFLRVYQAAPGYRPTAKFSTWLYRIVVNHCLNYRRDTGRNPSVPMSALSTGEERNPLDIPVEADPAKGTEHDELRAAVIAALRALPIKQRMAVILDKYQGLSHREIGMVLRCSEKAVKSLLARARENLRHLLNRHIS